MRMFLVGMCDIFLLLYLTTLAEMDARPVSRLTVQDYRVLEKATEELSTKAETVKGRLAKEQRETARLRRRLEAALEEKTQMTAEAERARGELSGTTVLAKEKERVAAELEKKEQEALQRLSVREEELQRVLAAEQKTRLEAEESAREREKLSAEFAKKEAEARLQISNLSESLRRSHVSEEEKKRQAEEARGAAERALKETEILRKKTEIAEQARAEAESAARAARNAEEAARIAAQESQSKAHQAMEEAEDERERARRAAARSDQAELDVARMTQPFNTAYADNILSKIVSVDLTVRRRGVFGDDAEELRFSLIPVHYGDEKVVFVPLNQTGLDDLSRPEDLEQLTARLGRETARAVYISGGPHPLMGFAFPAGGRMSEPLHGSFSSFMPTLIAVRNGTRFPFKDRIRGLNEEQFFFPRDRLREERGNVFRFTSEGFRGTGDYSERIVEGDQIVDLEGTFLGVAIQDGLIMPVSRLKNWRRSALDGRGLDEVASSITELRRR